MPVTTVLGEDGSRNKRPQRARRCGKVGIYKKVKLGTKVRWRTRSRGEFDGGCMDNSNTRIARVREGERERERESERATAKSREGVRTKIWFRDASRV